MADQIDALLALRRDGRFIIGRDRIALLEAVARTGSITSAARETGLSYKTAWEAVNAINNLMPKPAFVTRSGSGKQAGATLTPEGQRLIETFHKLESRLAALSQTLAQDGLEGGSASLFWLLGLKLSARNVLQTEVAALHFGAVDVDVTLRLGNGQNILAQITTTAAQDLALAPGRPALAILKAPSIQIAAPDSRPLPGENHLPGHIHQITTAQRNSEIMLALGDGKMLTSIMPRQHADPLGLKPGARALACFAADQVILAAD